MASFLYRLGRFAFRRRWLVVGLWLAVLAAGVTGAATLSGPTSDAFRIPGTPSQQAIDLLQERFPQASADGATLSTRISPWNVKSRSIAELVIGGSSDGRLCR